MRYKRPYEEGEVDFKNKYDCVVDHCGKPRPRCKSSHTKWLVFKGKYCHGHAKQIQRHGRITSVYLKRYKRKRK